jgi:hypothetical protein
VTTLGFFSSLFLLLAATPDGAPFTALIGFSGFVTTKPGAGPPLILEIAPPPPGGFACEVDDCATSVLEVSTDLYASSWVTHLPAQRKKHKSMNYNKEHFW